MPSHATGDGVESETGCGRIASQVLVQSSTIADLPAIAEGFSLPARRRGTALWLVPSLLLLLLLVLTVSLWRVEVQARVRDPQLVLWGGLCVSFAMAGAVFYSLLHRVQAQEQAQRHMAALESLHAISAAISAQLGAGSPVLDQLAGAACRLLGMSRAAISLLDEQKRTIEIVASAGDLPANSPRVFSLADLPYCTECLDTGHPVFAQDISKERRPYPVHTARLFKLVSAVFIPLQVERRRIGVLTVLDSKPKTFSPFDRRLAELLASQASVILFNSQLYERMRSALEARTRLLRQRKALSAANAAIQSTPTIDESLRQITQLIPSAMGGDLCGLTLLTGRQRESVLVAATPPFDRLTGTASGPSALADEAFRTGSPLTVADARADQRVHQFWKQIANVGSILYVPMFGGNRRPLGILAIARHTTGVFSQEQIELAQTFSALAALAVENARLLEQTRRDADAKTVLLRELNHRVKNNLAAIVALLSIKPPPMPADVRDWLDRATDRIRAMAGAHQLFTGDVERVTLEALVGQTISSLSVAKPANVEVQTELNGVRLSLDTEQAVGLAMALHELCFNALVHALGEGGTLTIRARNSTDASAAPGTVVIEVMDDGCGMPEGADGSPAGTVGQGLGLVRGLVRRELRGTFSLRPREQGGTVAAIEFPALPEEPQREIA